MFIASHHDTDARIPSLATRLKADKSYFIEDTDPHDRYMYRLERMVCQRQSAYQRITIADTYSFGRALMLDGAIQSAQADEALYHELLVQPAMLRHPEPRDVLIIGGGEGASLREVLAHRSVRSATMVDLDPEVVELCREHMPTWHRGALEDARTRLVFGDGREFVESNDDKYDIVIIDVVDMFDNGPAQALYTRQFYEGLRRRLRPGFLVAVQGLEFSFINSQPHATLVRTLRTVFPQVASYSALIPSFLSAWGFVVASDDYQPGTWQADQIEHAIALKLGQNRLAHLDGRFVESAFTHCLATRRMLAEPGPILEDDMALDLDKDDGDEGDGAVHANVASHSQ